LVAWLELRRAFKFTHAGKFAFVTIELAMAVAVAMRAVRAARAAKDGLRAAG
jgi:hypothetical protein